MSQTVWDQNMHNPKKINHQFPAFPLCNCFTQHFLRLKILIVNVLFILHFNFSLSLIVNLIHTFH